MQQPLAAVVIITAAKEEAREEFMKSKKSVGGWEWIKGLNKHRTLNLSNVKPEVNSELTVLKQHHIYDVT